MSKSKRRHRGPLSFEEKTGEEFKRFTVSLSQSQLDWLSATAAARGVSMADVVRELITAAMGEGRGE